MTSRAARMISARRSPLLVLALMASPYDMPLS
jgi:hypothetical protein